MNMKSEYEFLCNKRNIIFAGFRGGVQGEERHQQQDQQEQGQAEAVVLGEEAGRDLSQEC